MNGPVGKGGSAIMTVSMSQSHTQKAMLRKSRRRRKKRRECQKGNLVHVLRTHPQLHQSAPGLCVWATKWSVCGQETVATSSRSPVFTVLLLAFLVAEKWRWTLSPSRKWAPGGPKGWPRGFLAPKPPLGSQHRRKRQKCLQLSASETATASSSSSQAVHPPEAFAAVGSGGDQHPQQRSCLPSVSVFMLGRLGARSLQALSVPSSQKEKRGSVSGRAGARGCSL